ncbi:MAG: 3-deoxy-D-manno-octulosonic acid transferase [Chlamydiales bacterium]
MIHILYNCIAPFILLLNLKKISVDRFQIPRIKRKKGKLFWVHAVSVGETKAAIPLIRELQKRNPKAQIVLSCGTQTGLAEAKRAFADVDCFRLPFDSTWLMKPLVKNLEPTHFFLVETDLWPNLLHFLKRSSVPCSLVSAKMSERSFKRYRLLPAFAKYQMSHFDHICLQSDEYRKCFAPFYKGELFVTGNLKWDTIAIEKSTRRNKKLTITLGSTHAGEEKLLLEALKNLPAKIYVLPRHPERFLEVAEIVKEYPNSQLIDQMGVLYSFYAKSDIAIVGGSFLPGVGGHNIFEPLAFGTPVIFGPHMWGQKKMTKLALEMQAGAQCEPHELPIVIKKMIGKGEIGQKLLQNLKGATQKTLNTCL